ncbi:hypothetical protein FIM12_04595 [SAR202 cluster bacterium AD-804-J14_MRT_500m]|nr:hypothetical protein [SAR202 cluster bacterium AD-804-J14_MRT_500m]
MINKRTSLLLLAVWATSRGEISYRDAVAHATRLLGKSEPSKADRQAFSAGACNLKAHNLVTLEMHTTRVARIKAVRSYSVNQVWKRGLTRYIEREVDIPTREKVFESIGWYGFTKKQQDDCKGAFAWDLFWLLIRDVAFYLARGLTPEEAANAINNFVPPSLARALAITSKERRMDLVRASEMVTGWAREKSDPMRGAFLFTDTIAPDWAYSGPKYEHEKRAVGLAENELNRLVNQKGLDRISELRTFGSWVYAFYHMGGLGIRG